jgi:hypothetical protein
MAVKVSRIDSLSPATNDLRYYGRTQNDTHFNNRDVFNTIVAIGSLAVLLLYSTVLWLVASEELYAARNCVGLDFAPGDCVRKTALRDRFAIPRPIFSWELRTSQSDSSPLQVLRRNFEQHARSSWFWSKHDGQPSGGGHGIPACRSAWAEKLGFVPKPGIGSD